MIMDLFVCIATYLQWAVSGTKGYVCGRATCMVHVFQVLMVVLMEHLDGSFDLFL